MEVGKISRNSPLNKTVAENKSRIEEMRKENASNEEVKSLSDTNGWLNLEVSLYNQLSDRVRRANHGGHGEVVEMLNYTFQKLAEDAKFIFNAKQDEIIASKNGGPVSCWSHPVSRMRVMVKDEPEKFNEIMQQRKNFFETKCDEVIEMRKSMPSLTSPLGSRKSISKTK